MSASDSPIGDLNKKAQGEEEARILLLEDMDPDAFLCEIELKKLPFPFRQKRVWTKEDYLRELEEFIPDLIISDFVLSEFSGIDAYLLLREKIKKDIPFILYTGAQKEQFAIDCLDVGIDDCIFKSTVGMRRLPFAVQKAIEMSRLKRKLETMRGNGQPIMERPRSNIERSRPDEIILLTERIAQNFKAEWEKKVVKLMKEIDALLAELGRPRKYGRT